MRERVSIGCCMYAFIDIVQFERSIVDVCNRINATENIRGINYRFNKNGSDLNDVTKQMYIHAGTGLKPHYVSINRQQNEGQKH